MEKEKTKLYQKPWFWVIIIILLIYIISICTNNKESTITSANLDKKVTIGKLTYYINGNWDNKENLEENNISKYYYPSSDTMLMVMVIEGEDYGTNTINNSFLDSFLSGMNLNDNDIISKKITQINGYNCGMIKFYMYNDNERYEAIVYIILNNDELYAFLFNQKNKLNNTYIELTENIISKAEIIKESEEEQINEEQINTTIENKNNETTTIDKTQSQDKNQNQQSTNQSTTNNHTTTNTQKTIQSNSQTTKPSASTEAEQSATVNIQAKYQTILNEYSTKLKNKTPSLITEYKSEASKNTNGLNGLATICNNKVSILAEICSQGIEKMAEIYYKYGSGKYSEYESWSSKLQDVYMEEAGKIQDVYLKSAM